MTRTPFFLAAGAATALASSVSRDAHAIGPVDVEVGAIAGAGTVPTHQGNGAVVSGYVSPPAVPNPLGFGLGGRAGVGFHGLYAGVEGTYDFGGSSGPPYGVKANSDLIGVDVGYSFKLPIVTIRPLVGIGNFTETVSGLPQPSCPAGSGPCSVPSSQSYNTLYVQPGITGLISLGTFYVGADANLLVLTSLPEYAGCNCSNGHDQLELALTFHAQVGVRF
jgi:hypothetical protein